MSCFVISAVVGFGQSKGASLILIALSPGSPREKWGFLSCNRKSRGPRNRAIIIPSLPATVELTSGDCCPVQVYRRELEEDGVVVDPLKSYYTAQVRSSVCTAVCTCACGFT